MYIRSKTGIENIYLSNDVGHIDTPVGFLIFSCQSDLRRLNLVLQMRLKVYQLPTVLIVIHHHCLSVLVEVRDKIVLSAATLQPTIIKSGYSTHSTVASNVSSY